MKRTRGARRAVMRQISVIIVSWNAREFLRNCLKSIRDSGGPLVREVIVVDNGSADGSPDMVAEEFPEATVVRSSENLGFARANNLGFQRASGSWLALANSDAIVHPGCFENLVAVLEGNQSVGLVGPKVLWPDGHVQVTRRQFPTVWRAALKAFCLDKAIRRPPFNSARAVQQWGHETQEHPCKPADCECSRINQQVEVEVLAGCFWLARREAVEQVGGLDERFFFYGEDVDWCRRFWDAGWKVVFVPKAVATHFGGASSSKAALQYTIEMLRSNVAYWKKHYGLWGQAALYSLSVFHHTIRLVAQCLKLAIGRQTRDQGANGVRRSWVCLRWLLSGKAVPNSAKGQ